MSTLYSHWDSKPSLMTLSDHAILCTKCHVMAHRGGLIPPLKTLPVRVAALGS
jgi:predicted HNH restriction endonuclease